MAMHSVCVLIKYVVCEDRFEGFRAQSQMTDKGRMFLRCSLLYVSYG